MNIDSFAVGGPDRIGDAGIGDSLPGASFSVEQKQATLIQREGTDVFAVGGPAGTEDSV
jgi:hypothetical protein